MSRYRLKSSVFQLWQPGHRSRCSGSLWDLHFHRFHTSLRAYRASSCTGPSFRNMLTLNILFQFSSTHSFLFSPSKNFLGQSDEQAILLGDAWKALYKCLLYYNVLGRKVCWSATSSAMSPPFCLASVTWPSLSKCSFWLGSLRGSDVVSYILSLTVGLYIVQKKSTQHKLKPVK